MVQQQEAKALVKSLGDMLSLSSLQDNLVVRKEAIRLSRALTLALDDPMNTATELAFSPYLAMSARVAVDMELFTTIVQEKGPITSTRLAQLTNAEELLIVRILRPLSAAGFVDEVGKQSWEANPITEAMANEGVAAGHRFVFEMNIGTAVKAPKFFKEAGYQSPSNAKDGIVQYAFQSKLGMFDLLKSKPEMLRDFNTFMGNTMGARKYWVDWYPVQERLLLESDANAALMVDIGGGRGHDLEAFHKKFPGSGTLVLEDLPCVMEDLETTHSDMGIQRISHDFFTEQPVKGARVYFLHHVLHDWSDENCVKILRNVKSAMRAGYSKLLIHELILPDTGASLFASSYDLTTMTFNSGLERTRDQWRSVLEKAGFEVARFWVEEEDADGIVEAMVKEQ